ncbi:hypothetical protein CSUI_005756, partial [Cystoisospora suis]
NCQELSTSARGSSGKPPSATAPAGSASERKPVDARLRSSRNSETSRRSSAQASRRNSRVSSAAIAAGAAVGMAEGRNPPSRASSGGSCLWIHY